VTDPEVRPLHADEHGAAAGVASRALADSPTAVAIHGDNTLDALAGLHRELAPFFSMLPPPQIGALAGACVIGVAGLAPPGLCIGTFMRDRNAELIGSVEPPGGEVPGDNLHPTGDPDRARVFWGHWARADLPDEHWHLGPVGIEPGLQGRGIGGAIMRAVCDGLDRDGRPGWLETDKERNVRFYAALGFELAGQETILGVPTWYMRRDARA
jgi:GNAT superfamily N-acetyltransferase